jgi:hypothetical protein
MALLRRVCFSGGATHVHQQPFSRVKCPSQHCSLRQHPADTSAVTAASHHHHHRQQHHHHHHQQQQHPAGWSLLLLPTTTANNNTTTSSRSSWAHPCSYNTSQPCSPYTKRGNGFTPFCAWAACSFCTSLSYDTSALLVTHASRASWVPTSTSSCCPLLMPVYSSRRCSR